MKTTIILRLSFLLLPILILANSFGQKNTAFNSIANSGPVINSSYNSSFERLENLVNSEKVSKKILKYFDKNFNGASHIEWGQVDENLLASFVRGETRTRALFNENGKLIYTIDIFSEKKLPAEVKNQVMKNYKDYSITSATKISEANRKIWVIKLAGKHNFATVRIENGEMEEVENFRKT